MPAPASHPLRPGPRWLLLAVLAVFVPGPSWAEDVAAGIDLWITQAEGGTSASVTLDIPADFFRSGSDALPQLEIPLVGEALPTQTGSPPLDRADTIVERQSAAHLSICGPVDTVPLKIVALRLKGMQPVTVTYNRTSPELWNVRACLSSAAQLPGSLRIRQECAAGGTFESDLPLRPKLVFRRQDGSGDPRVLDWLQYPNVVKEALFQAHGRWAHEAPPGFPRITAPAGVVTDGDCDGNWDLPLSTGTTQNFVIGLQPGTSCSCPSAGKVPRKASDHLTGTDIHHEAPLHFHPVDPASEDSRAFRNRDRDRWRDKLDLSWIWGKTPVFFLALAAGAGFAAWWPWRRRRPGPKD